MAPEADSLKLPLSVITIIDLGRLERELATIDNFVLQLSLRSAGTQPSLPKVSRALEELARLNGINLLFDADRENLKRLLGDMREHAPIVHLSFATDPPSFVLTKLVGWFRKNAHPYTLLQVGLQPSIAAGTIVRTANKQFDFTLRKHFDAQRQLLIDKLVQGSARGGE